MALDITALRMLKYRDRWEKLARSVPPGSLQPLPASLLEDFGVFFREFPDAQRIEHGPFLTWFTGFRHPTMKDDSIKLYSAIIDKAMVDVSPEIEAGLMERLVAAGAAASITTLLEKWNSGDEINLYLSLRNEVEKFEAQVQRKVRNPQVLDAIEDLLKEEELDVGLHWRLPCLNRHVKPLRGGDFVIIAARPDKGKTTFCAAELTCMAAQLDEVYPGENRSILWFNNEGPGNKIVKRVFQAALNATTEDLIRLSSLPADPEFAKYRTQVRQQYAAALGGRPGALRIFDIHDMWSHDVEDIIKQHNPGLIVFDMLDNIKFGGETSNNGQRTDQLLEAMYQWGRLIGVKYDCPVIATSQISADGDGEAFPTMPKLKDSKTGKQGAADLIITLGALNDPMLEMSRYIGTTKNKLVRTGKKNNPQQEVHFDSQRARYVEPT
jgi:replicative DNA helicase